MSRIEADHLTREAIIYVRQSTVDQVNNNVESRRRQYGLVERARQLGWVDVSVIDDDLGRSGSGVSRPGFENLLAAICEGRVGAVTPEAIAAWHPARTGRPGRSAHYSDLAIETGVMLRLAFARPWRQTEGLLRSVTTLLGLSLDVPDHTTLSRRSAALSLVTALAVPAGPVTVVIDSTGLKVFGAGEWQMAKHGGRDRRTWRKLHLAIDPDTGEVLASALTTTEEGDASRVRPLLDQIAAPIAAVLADGAYDGDPVYRAVADRGPAATVIIPPRATAVVSEVSAAGAPTPRDRHIEMIAAKGRLGWQKALGYGRRSLVETGMLRYKTIIGRTLRARTLPAQKVEARVGCKVLNRMTALGMPVSRRLA